MKRQKPRPVAPTNTTPGCPTCGLTPMPPSAYEGIDKLLEIISSATRRAITGSPAMSAVSLANLTLVVASAEGLQELFRQAQQQDDETRARVAAIATAPDGRAH